MKCLSLITFFLVLEVGFSVKPDYIHSCKKDATLPKCMEDNFNSAIKFLAINGDTSLHAPDIKKFKLAKLSLNTRTFEISVTNTLNRGLENVKLVLLTLEEDVLHIRGVVPRFQYDGDYIMNGQILALPIKGKGKVNNTHTGITFDITMKLRVEERNGKKYYFVGFWNDVEIHLDVKKTYFQFDNLFDGDQQLGAVMNNVLNDNDGAVFDEIRSVFEEGFGFYVVIPYINAYLGAIPIDELFEK